METNNNDDDDVKGFAKAKEATKNAGRKTWAFMVQHRAKIALVVGLTVGALAKDPVTGMVNRQQA